MGIQIIGITLFCPPILLSQAAAEAREVDLVLRSCSEGGVVVYQAVARQPGDLGKDDSVDAPPENNATDELSARVRSLGSIAGLSEGCNFQLPAAQ